MFSSDENDSSAALLTRITELFIQGTGLTPVMGAEIEFYCSQPIDNHDQLCADIETSCKAAGIATSPVEKERGTYQYELQLAHIPAPVTLASHLASVRTIITKLGEHYNAPILFDAKPYPTEPGSAIHIHISLLDRQQKNILQKQDGQESPLMLSALGGLCHLLPASMLFFSPTEASYQRFIPHMEAPTTVSWGGNNRTTALRIPDSSPTNRRIEHRAPSADCNPYHAISAMLAGIHYGITEKTPAPERIYGNAFDACYALTALPQTLAEAQKFYECSEVMRNYMPRHI